MPHPGYEYARRAASTFKGLSCPRYGYLSQFGGVEPVPSGTFVAEGKLAMGQIFHTAMEVFYTPDRHKGKPLRGTDNNPIIDTIDDVWAYYLDQGYAPSTVTVAKEGVQRYLDEYGDDVEIRSRVLNRPEFDVHADFGPILDRGTNPRQIPYSAQLDLLVKDPYGDGVAGVEHKFLADFRPLMLQFYTKSGQIAGQAASWNARADYVKQYGPMNRILMNLVFKGGKTRVHREWAYVPATRQMTYIRAVAAQTDQLELTMRQYRAARDAGDSRGVERCWPKLGMLRQQCVDIAFSCKYLQVCENDRVDGLLYQITDAGKNRLTEDGVVKVDLDARVIDSTPAQKSADYSTKEVDLPVTLL